jgi:hypothetical protein
MKKTLRTDSCFCTLKIWFLPILVQFHESNKLAIRFHEVILIQKRNISRDNLDLKHL